MANYRKSSRKTRGHKRSNTRRRASSVRHRRSHTRRHRQIQSGG
jgi:hypothetical protein